MSPMSVRRAVAMLLASPILVMSTALPAADAPRDAIEEVVVVANRTPTELDKVGSSVTVVSEAVIERSQAVVLADLLATTPGIMFSRNGGPGTQTSLRIRGAESDQTLVLIDGVQINDPSSTGGGFDFGNLLVGDVVRVEILRGPQSTLYGSQAIGGVVNIVTREGKGPLSTRLQAEYGSRSTSQIRAGVGGEVGGLTYRLGGARYKTDGVSAFSGGTETDPFQNDTFAGRVGYAFSPDFSVDFRAYYADGQSNYDGFPPPLFVFADEGDYTNSRQLVAYGGVNFGFFDGRWKNRVAYQSTDVDRSTYLRTATSSSRTGLYEGKNRRWEYQGNVAIADGYSAVFGFQDEQSEMNSLSAPRHAEVGQKSYYLQLQAEVVQGLTLTGGVRNDDHDTFGSHTTTQVAAAWSLQSGTVLRASWGEGFKAPTLYQLFSDYRNPDLVPEESEGWDAGIEQSLSDGRVTLSATYFERNTRNQISFANCPPPSVTSACRLPGHSPFGYYLNTAKARATGVELQGSFRPTDDFEINANLTNMAVNDRTPGATTFGNRLLRRPDTTANVEVAYTWPVRVQTSAAVRYTSSQKDQDFNSFPTRLISLPSYTLLDLRASYPLTRQLEITGRVENVFDEKYETVYQYGSVGRASYVGLSLRF